MKKPLLLSALLALTSCAPVVLHKAHVDPGGRAGLTGGLREPLCDTGCTAGLIPPLIAAYAEYGITSADTTGWAAMLTTTIPGIIFFPAASVELYVQAPAPPRALTAGAGVVASVQDVMPYVQFGQTTRLGSWYVVNGYVRAAERPETDVFFNGPRGGLIDDFVGSTYWSPQLGYESRNGRFTLYAAGAFGRSAVIREGSDPPEADGHRSVRLIFFGAAFRRTGPFDLPIPVFGSPPTRTPDR